MRVCVEGYLLSAKTLLDRQEANLQFLWQNNFCQFSYHFNSFKQICVCVVSFLLLLEKLKHNLVA